jgi:hypothetical protein
MEIFYIIYIIQSKPKLKNPNPSLVPQHGLRYKSEKPQPTKELDDERSPDYKRDRPL